MIYRIEIEYNNGYRCCCSRSWEYEVEVETIEEALAYVPRDLRDRPDYCCGKVGQSTYPLEQEVESVRVKDATGEEVASGYTRWSHGFGKPGIRGHAYKYTLWSGFRPDGQFRSIYKGHGGEEVADVTWEELAERTRGVSDE